MSTIRRDNLRDATVRPSLRGGWTVAAAALCLLGASPGADPPETVPTAVGPETLVLFDGKSLDGWQKTAFFRPGEVKVEGGALVMGAGTPMTGVTSTRPDLPRTDYELSYEARRLDGNDFFAAATFPVGKSYVTLINGGWGGNVTGLSSLDGMDASENETGTSVRFRDGIWYRFRVRVTDEVIRCWVDDTQVIDVEIRGRLIGTRIETRANQPLGFATYEATGAIRVIEIRTLTPAEVAATNKSDR
jgi:hypothetical protein